LDGYYPSRKAAKRAWNESVAKFRKERKMKDIPEIVRFLKALPVKMEGYNSKGELIVLDMHKLAETIDAALEQIEKGCMVIKGETK
jgi:hypothetical protein